jgi:hypothetical protein
MDNTVWKMYVSRPYVRLSACIVVSYMYNTLPYGRMVCTFHPEPILRIEADGGTGTEQPCLVRVSFQEQDQSSIEPIDGTYAGKFHLSSDAAGTGSEKCSEGAGGEEGVC